MSDKKNALELQVESEFLEEAQDIMNNLEILRENLRSNYNEDDMLKFRKNVQLLGAQAHAADFGIVSLLAHRLEDYLQRIHSMAYPHSNDVRMFLDKIEAALDGSLSVAKQNASAELVRELPMANKFEHEFGDLEKKNIEILVIVPDKAMGTIVEREMAACGYRVSFAKTSFKGFELAVRTRPDMILAAGEIDELSGIDLANAFATMPSVYGIPFALLTSRNWGHPSLKGLPPSSGLVRKGKEFGDDIAECFKRFGIT
jgi:CheY-like chemotaxis protein